MSEHVLDPPDVSISHSFQLNKRGIYFILTKYTNSKEYAYIFAFLRWFPNQEVIRPSGVLNFLAISSLVALSGFGISEKTKKK